MLVVNEAGCPCRLLLPQRSSEICWFRALRFERQVLGKAANNTALAWAVREGVDVALDLSYMRTKDYVKPYVIEEMKGIAAATGVDLELVRRLNWIPELTRGASIYAWLCVKQLMSKGSWGSISFPTICTDWLRRCGTYC